MLRDAAAGRPADQGELEKGGQGTRYLRQRTSTCAFVEVAHRIEASPDRLSPTMMVGPGVSARFSKRDYSLERFRSVTARKYS